MRPHHLHQRYRVDRPYRKHASVPLSSSLRRHDIQSIVHRSQQHCLLTLSLSFDLRLSVCLSLSVCRSVCLYVFMSVCLSLSLHRYLWHLKLLAHALDDKFKQKMEKVVAAAAARGDGGPGSVRHYPASVKSILRMSAKLRADHKMNNAPRSAANIDIVRCGVSCATPEDLLHAYDALQEEFGGHVVRVKNGYSPDFDPLPSVHYRGCLINVAVRACFFV